MKLSEIIKRLPIKECFHNGNIDIKGVSYNSKEVKDGFIFVAIRGLKTDGHSFIREAIVNGAVAVITEKPFLDLQSTPFILVPNSRRALSLVSSEFCGNSSSRLKLIGITGTNGKTTTAYLIESILSENGINTGVIGTVNYRYGGIIKNAPVTTPESLDLHMMLKDMEIRGVSHVVMEVSSHALDLERVNPSEFDIKVFTNLTQDHLDYHRNMGSYFRSKLRLFKEVYSKGEKYADSVSVINSDDNFGKIIIEETTSRVISYGMNGISDIKPLKLMLSDKGIDAEILTPEGNLNISSKLMGDFNLYNIMAAIGVGIFLGLPLDKISRGINLQEEVPGRLEIIKSSEDFTVVIDYAHTPDALERVIKTLRGICNGRIISVFGCGGDRDRGKRPLMGKISTDLSDITIITSDNPRTEDPKSIIEDIINGIDKCKDKNYLCITERAHAISEAIKLAVKKDIVLIAGKGHEDYQIIGNNRIHFSDKEEVNKALIKLGRV